MRINYCKYIISVAIFLLLAWTISCSGKSGSRDESKPAEASPAPAADSAPLKLIKLLKPEENAEYKLNQSIDVEVVPEFKNRIPDSVAIYFDGNPVETMKSEPWKCTIPGNVVSGTGRKALKVIAYKDGKIQNPVARFLVVFSDIVPKSNGFRVVNSYQHDIKAFTQGLFYDGGLLYESTGQETESSLREVELTTGRIIRQLNIDASLFGEGITLCKGRIFHVTWRSKVGFVYEKETFKQINKIYYPTEGWGLTTLDDRIVMSDGTNILYFYEPEMFTSVSRIEVFDNEKKVDSLNELEYINGEIWANIWMEDRIARIDPVSGKVNAYIDLEGLFPQNERNPEAEVLNGIAYDPATKRIFVTGKRWSKLYEIRVTE
jgi:glutaminyl-peptide cyclotransferase